MSQVKFIIQIEACFFSRCCQSEATWLGIRCRVCLAIDTSAWCWASQACLSSWTDVGEGRLTLIWSFEMKRWTCLQLGATLSAPAAHLKHGLRCAQAVLQTVKSLWLFSFTIKTQDNFSVGAASPYTRMTINSSGATLDLQPA